MLAIKRIIKYLVSKILSLNFLERLSQNKIWRGIIEQKKPEIVSSVNGKLTHDAWNKQLRYKVWDRVHEYINIDEDILYLEFGVWQGLSIKYLSFCSLILVSISGSKLCGSSASYASKAPAQILSLIFFIS